MRRTPRLPAVTLVLALLPALVPGDVAPAHLTAASHRLSAQPSSLVVQVADAATGAPLINAEVIDQRSTTRRLTDARGEARLPWGPDGILSLRIRELGFRFEDRLVRRSDLRGDTLRVVLTRIAWTLPAVHTRATSACDANPDPASAALTSLALEQLRMGAERYETFRDAYPFRIEQVRRTISCTQCDSAALYDSLRRLSDAAIAVRRTRIVTFVASLRGDTARISIETEAAESRRWGDPYVRGGVLRDEPLGVSVPLFFITALGDREFLESHCFVADGMEAYEGSRVLRLAFAPRADVRTPDWQGMALLDSATALLRRVEFRLVNLRRDRSLTRMEGYTRFAAPSPLIAVPDSTVTFWWHRPERTDGSWPPPDRMQSLATTAFSYRGAVPPEGRSWEAGYLAVSGMVVDSLTNRPLADAIVQLVPVAPSTNAGASPGERPRNVRTARDGRFDFDRVHVGIYRATFFHPALDSLGLEAPVRQILVDGRDEVELTLATPSAATLLRGLCPTGVSTDSATLLLGTVRSATTGAAFPRAVVVLRSARDPQLATTADSVSVAASPSGAFVACVARAREVIAIPHAESDIGLPAHLAMRRGSVVHRDFFVGSSDRLRARTLVGVLQDTAGRPVPNGAVRIWGFEGQGRSGRDGRFSLDGPYGTITVDARAVGFERERLTIDVLPGADSDTLRFVLRRLTRLDTVVVAAAREPDAATGFAVRRRATPGRFLVASDVAQVPAMYLTEVLARLPAVRVGTQRVGGLLEPSGMGRRLLLTSSAGAACTPTVFIDNMRFEAAELDDFVVPAEVLGVEVYVRPAEVPAVFHTVTDCGVIAVWTGARSP